MEQEALRTLFSNNKANKVYNEMTHVYRKEWGNVISGKFSKYELKGTSQRMTILAVTLLEMATYIDCRVEAINHDDALQTAHIRKEKITEAVETTSPEL